MPDPFKEGVKALETILHRHDVRKPDPYLAAYAHLFHILHIQVPLLLEKDRLNKAYRLLGFAQGAFRAWGWQLDNRPAHLEGNLRDQLTRTLGILNSNVGRNVDSPILSEEMPRDLKSLPLPMESLTRSRLNYILENWAAMQTLHDTGQPFLDHYCFGIQMGLYWVLGLSTLAELEMISENLEAPPAFTTH